MKNITLTKRMARDWLIRNGYRKEDIVFNKRSSPDFILSDGRKIEVKRLAGNTIYFTAKQWESLTDDVEVFIMREDSKTPVAIVPFSEVRRAVESGGKVRGGFNVTVSMSGKVRLEIWLSPSLRRKFKEYASYYRDYEEALKSLLIKAGVLREAPIF
ncbi:MAG: hypothetical protein QXT14_02695 [Candidatus Bathyarchaeia archaeon]